MQSHPVIKNNKGLSLVELLVGIGILSVISFAIMNMIQSSFLASKGVDNSRNANSLIFEVKEIFSNQAQCTGNLRKGLPPLTSSSNIDLTVIDRFKNDLTLDAPPFFQIRNGSIPGTIRDGLEIIKATVVLKDKVSDAVTNSSGVIVSNKIYFAEFQLTVRQAEKATGPVELKRSFPVTVHLDSADKVVMCNSTESNILTNEEIICDIYKNGRYKYDPVDKKCESRYDFDWFTGNTDEASCPTGWSPIHDLDVGDLSLNPGGLRCATTGGSMGYTGTLPTYTYKTAGPTAGGPEMSKRTFNSSLNKCECDWVAPHTSGGVVFSGTYGLCQIRCEKQIKF
jgi:type II secretory pathway pseudopilin PulG